MRVKIYLEFGGIIGGLVVGEAHFDGHVYHQTHSSRLVHIIFDFRSLIIPTGFYCSWRRQSGGHWWPYSDRSVRCDLSGGLCTITSLSIYTWKRIVKPSVKWKLHPSCFIRVCIRHCPYVWYSIFWDKTMKSGVPEKFVFSNTVYW